MIVLGLLGMIMNMSPDFSWARWCPCVGMGSHTDRGAHELEELAKNDDSDVHTLDDSPKECNTAPFARVAQNAPAPLTSSDRPQHLYPSPVGNEEFEL